VFVRKVEMRVASFLAGAALLALAAPAMAVTTYTDQSAFTAAAPGAVAYAFPDMGEGTGFGPVYDYGPATFESDQLFFYDDAYGTPYISDDNSSGADNTFTISTTGDALGLRLGSYFGGATYSYP
jgi:hypothetical protein